MHTCRLSDGFFYRCDSGLYRALRDSFRAIIPSMRDEDSLCMFRSAGYYLIDVCQVPVDRLNRHARRVACIDAERATCPAHQGTLTGIDPDRFALDQSQRAARRVRGQLAGPVFDFPYPGQCARHRNTFLDLLVPRLDLPCWGLPCRTCP
jgi:hypothetical protein